MTGSASSIGRCLPSWRRSSPSYDLTKTDRLYTGAQSSGVSARSNDCQSRMSQRTSDSTVYIRMQRVAMKPYHNLANERRLKASNAIEGIDSVCSPISQVKLHLSSFSM